MLNNKSKQTGFTLIELLVVTTIIIVLTTIGVVSYTNAGQTARNSKRKADIETVRQALVLYRSDEVNYPSGTYSDITAALISGGYLSAPAPTEPKTPATPYNYTINSPTNSTFCLCATTEGTTKGNASTDGANGSCSFGVGNYYCAASP